MFKTQCEMKNAGPVQKVKSSAMQSPSEPGDCTGHMLVKAVLPIPPCEFRSRLPLHKPFLLPGMFFPRPAPPHAQPSWIFPAQSASLLLSLYSVYLLPSLHQLEMSCIHVQDLSLLLYCELQEGRNQVYFVPCSFSSTQHIVGIQETFAE